MIDRRSAVLGTLAAGVAARVVAQTAPPMIKPGLAVPGLPEPSEAIDLWPGGAPGAPARPLVETVDERSKDSMLTDRAVYGISKPRPVMFSPAVPNGSAVLVTPGGGQAGW